MTVEPEVDVSTTCWKLKFSRDIPGPQRMITDVTMPWLYILKIRTNLHLYTELSKFNTYCICPWNQHSCSQESEPLRFTKWVMMVALDWVKLSEPKILLLIRGRVMVSAGWYSSGPSTKQSFSAPPGGSEAFPGQARPQGLYLGI